MADSAEVVEAIQTDAAESAVSNVEAVVVGTAGAIASEVAIVDAHLADHAETSEERHEEILEGQAWLENQFQLQTSRMQTMEMNLSALSSHLQANQTILESLNQRLSTGLNPSTPSIPNPTPDPTPVVVVEPENEEAVLPVPEPPAKRRRVRVI